MTAVLTLVVGLALGTTLGTLMMANRAIRGWEYACGEKVLGKKYEGSEWEMATVVAVSWHGSVCVRVELSSEEYDEEKGIVDPDTELAWRIEHELADVVRGFCQYVHVVVERGKYGNKDRVERHYFDSVEKAARYVFEEDGHDLLSEYGEVVHQYPNKDIRLRVTYVGDEGGKIKLKGEKLQRRDGEFAVDYEYSIEYLVFRKGMRI